MRLRSRGWRFRGRQARSCDAASPRKPCPGRPGGHGAPAARASFLTAQSGHWPCVRAAGAGDRAQRAQRNPPRRGKAPPGYSPFLSCSALRWSKPRASANKKGLGLVPYPPATFFQKAWFFALMKELAAPEEILYRWTPTSTTSLLTAFLLLLFVQGGARNHTRSLSLCLE